MKQGGMKQKTMVLAALLAFASGLAKASTITFDNLSDNGYGTLISNGYSGLNWNNFGVTNTSLNNALSSSGYWNGIVSPTNVAFNENGTPASISTGSAFTFNSAYFTGAWNDGLQITIIGLLGGIQIDQATFTVNTAGPTFETFNWVNVDTLSFSSAGGTPAVFQGVGTHFVMDNLTINAVPEPASLWLLGIGLAGISVTHRRKPMA